MKKLVILIKIKFLIKVSITYAATNGEKSPMQQELSITYAAKYASVTDYKKHIVILAIDQRIELA